MRLCIAVGDGILKRVPSGVPDGGGKWGEKVVDVCGDFPEVHSSEYAQASLSSSLFEGVPL